MEIERVARKLEPLMPEQIQRWLRMRDTADADIRGLIDKQIVLTAQRKLGDYQKKILLSLPPKKSTRGQIELGTVLYNGERWPIGLRKDELLQHLGIFGRSGAGKTNLVFHLLMQLSAKGVPWLFFDWKRTCRHLLPQLKHRVNVATPGRSVAPFSFNPFLAPPGLEHGVYVQLVVDVLASAYTLGDGARSIVQKALLACYASGSADPSITQVLQEIEKLPDRERIRGWKISAVRALESLQLAKLTTTDHTTQKEIVRQLLHQSTILELDALSSNSKAFLIPVLCLWLYYLQLSTRGREKLQLVIVLEEAHHLLHGQTRARESVMEMLLRQCREIGIGVIIVDQHPHLLSPACTGNIYASICLNLKDSRDVNRAAALSLVPDEERGYFSILPVGQGICKLQDRWPQPFLVQFPKIEVRKGAVTDATLQGYQREALADSGRKWRQCQAFEGIPRVQVIDDGLEPDEWRLMEDVLTYPDDGIRGRYLRLGLSAGRGQRFKERLIQRSWLEATLVPVGNSRKVILRLSAQAKKWIGLEDGKHLRESLVHEYWKRRIANEYRRKGWTVQLEAPRVGGRVDVLAERNGKLVGVEVETGSSDVVKNVKNCLRAGFNRVIVVATNETALGKVEKELGREGLLIPNRVQIVLGCVTTDIEIGPQ